MTKAFDISQKGATTGARNLLINGDVSVTQRATDYSGGTGWHTIDRWYHGRSNMRGFAQLNTSGVHQFRMNSTITTSTNLYIAQGIPLTETGSNSQFQIGDTFTLSYEIFLTASLSSHSPTAYVHLQFADGSSGGNTTNVDSTYSNQISVATNQWVKVQRTITVDSNPAVTNKVLRVLVGSNLTTGTMDTDEYTYIRKVQFERGDVATDFEDVDPATQLMRCQRFYESVLHTNINFTSGYTTNGVTQFRSTRFKVVKRAVPTVVFTSHANSGYSNSTLSTITVDGFRSDAVATTTDANGYVRFGWTADAEI